MKGTLWCLHGAVGQAADWREFAIPGWSVKRVDLWRFLDCQPMSLPAFGRALNAEAAATADRKVLVGYSMGARLALHALIDQGPWDAAVLIAPHPGLATEAERSARREADAAWAALALTGEWRDFLATWNAQSVLAASRPLSPAPEGRRREIARSFIDWSLGTQEPLWEKLQDIHTPILWCTGELDPKFSTLADRATERLPHVEAWSAPGAGHRLPWDAPEAFPARVREFLERVLS